MRGRAGRRAVFGPVPDDGAISCKMMDVLGYEHGNQSAERDHRTGRTVAARPAGRCPRVLRDMEEQDASPYRLTDEQAAEVERRLANPNRHFHNLTDVKTRFPRS